MLKVVNLQMVYPNGYEALKDVSLEVQPGEIVAVIGRSGAGKSTLLRCINGLEKSTAGAIVLDGDNTLRMSNEELHRLQRRIGFIWQEFNLVERISVLSNVLSGRLGYCGSVSSSLFHFSREDREIAVRSLERVNMLHRARQRADRLSGGEKQRVAIARAIAQQPKLLLADEPVASLDPELSEQVMSDLARVARAEGVPTLINIHAVDLAREFCDRIIGIARGEVVFNGTPAELDATAMDRVYRFDKPPAEWPVPVRERPRELAGVGSR